MQRLIAFWTIISCLALVQHSQGQDSAEPSVPKEPLNATTATVSCRLKNVDVWLAAWRQIRDTGSFADGSEPLDRGGYGYPYLDVFDLITNQRETVAPAVAKVLGKPEDQIILVPSGKWNDDDLLELHKRQADKTWVTARFEATISSSGSIFNRVELSILVFPDVSDLKQPRQLAIGIAEAVATKLPETSEAVVMEEYKPKLQAAKNTYASMEIRLDQLEANRRGYQTAHPIPSEKLVERIASIEQQQLATQLALAGFSAREEATKEQVAIFSERLKKDSASDEMIDVLQQLVKLREAEVERMKELYRNDAVDKRAIDKAAANVLEARIQLIQARGEHRASAGNERLESLTNELTKLAIDRAEAEAKLRYMEKAHQKLAANRAEYLADEQHVQRLTTEIAHEAKSLEVARKRLDVLKAIKQNFKPLELIILPVEVPADGSGFGGGGF